MQALGSAKFVGNVQAFQSKPAQVGPKRGSLQVSYGRLWPHCAVIGWCGTDLRCWALVQVMAAGLKDMRDRIGSVKNTQKITEVQHGCNCAVSFLEQASVQQFVVGSTWCHSQG